MKSKQLRCFLYVLFILFGCSCLLFVVGCAARASKMIPASFDVEKKHPYSVKVEVIGGKETHPLWTSQISDTAFTEALGNAIVQSGVFTKVVKDEGADYLLDVTVLNYDQPAIGLDFDIKMETKWELSKAGEYKRIWTDTISTTYRSKLGDALVAAERLQKANEGAVRVNIEEAIKRLSRIQL
jgi:hypothetical protein